MCSQEGQASDSERAGRQLLCSTVDTIIMMGSMYQWVSLETRTAVASSLGCYLLYLLSLFVTIVCCWCCAFLALCTVHFCVRCSALTTLWSLGLCAIRVWVCASFCASLLPSNVAFWIELWANRFLQVGNNWQPANDRANTTALKDKVWRLQQIGFGAGKVEKGGDTAETILVVTLDNIGRQILGMLWTNDLSDYWVLWETTVGSASMSCEGQLNANMQVDDEAFMK